MYRLLIVTENQNVNDMISAMQGWEKLGFKPPRLRATTQEALECMKKHAIDAIAVDHAPAFEALLTCLDEQYPDMPMFQIASSQEEQMQIVQELSRLLEAARQDDQLLRLLGAHLYGLYLERLYMASVMVLAAAESDTLEPLYQVHTGLATRHGKALEILGKKGLLGLEDCETRAALVKKLQGLLTANKGQPTLEGLREIVSLVQEERAFFLTPCPLPQ